MADPSLPASWRPILAEELEKPYYRELHAFIARERREHTVYPSSDDVFAALEFTRYENANVLLLGQDPYHGPGQAHGLCFSVRPDIRPPPSLKNIFKELNDDVGASIPNNGHLTSWAEQGVLMLNAVLTVRAREAASHRKKGWETFTDAIIRRLNDRGRPVVFVLWGSYARRKASLIDAGRHTIIESVHPSPLSARRGFLGSRPFSAVNRALEAAGEPPIDWRIPDR